MAKFQARQGDIFFKQVPGLPKKDPSAPNSELKKKTDGIFAYGEVTGHAHKVISPAISDMDMYTDANGDIYVMSPNEDIKVGHDEHNVVTLPKDTWICISRQREYDPAAAEKERRVAD